MTAELSPIAAAAVSYARAGWPIVPLLGKRPIHKDWTTRASTDERQILAWLTENPDANIGIATGRSGWFVLDVDGEIGEASLAALVLEHGELPETLQARTGGGGRHILFAMPAGVEIGNSSNRVGKKLDTRGTGGQIVVQPSVHPETGALYEWLSDPATTAIAAAPAWLIALAIAPTPTPASNAPIVNIEDERARRFGSGALDSARRELALVMTGGNNALNIAAMRMAQLAAATGLTEADVESALREACTTNGLLTPAYEKQFRATFRSGWRAGLRSPRSVPAPNDRAESAGDDLTPNGKLQAKLFTAAITPRPWPSQDLREAYERWCAENRQPVLLGTKAFQVALTALGWAERRTAKARLRVHPLASGGNSPEFRHEVASRADADDATSESVTQLRDADDATSDDDDRPTDDDFPDWAGENAEEFAEQTTHSGGGNGGGEGIDLRPRIQVTNGELGRVVDEAEDALLDSGLDIYQRGGALVRPISEPVVTTRGIERRDGALLVKPVELDWLVEAMTNTARFEVWDGRTQAFRHVDAPAKVARTYMARAGQWRAPALVGIIEAPTIRPDGSVLERPGYDEATGLLFEPGRHDFRPVPDRPTAAQVAEAIDVYRELLSGFPFDAPHDFSVALAACLTALVRRTVPSAPMFAFNAPKMGSGKTLLANVAALLATGRGAASMTPAPDPEEEAKRLLALLVESDPVANIDNITTAWSSDAMCTILTEEVYKGRVLGSTKTATVPTCVTWMCTGNNLSLVGDLTTRVLRCDLDPQVERPEERTFGVDLKEWIPANRGMLVPALLTIARAYHVAGRPKQPIPTFGRFEVWSERVRAALVWAGLPDPCLSRADLEVGDSVRTGLASLLGAWHRVLGDERYTVKQAIGIAKFEENSHLLSAMLDIAGRSGEVNPARLGTWFKKYERRIEGGYRAEMSGVLEGNNTWRVKRISAVGPGGAGGTVPLPNRELPENKNHVNTHEPRENAPPFPPGPTGSAAEDFGDEDGLL